jgi:hypothetical protein
VPPIIIIRRRRRKKKKKKKKNWQSIRRDKRKPRSEESE